MKSTWICEPPIHLDENGKADVDPLIARILARRGISDPLAQEKFLNPSYSTDLSDPFLFDHMERSLARIERAIQQNEKITIYGDYDVDGVCATSILYETCVALGARIDIIINHREREGYGLQMPALERCKDAGTTLIITNDSGITNAAEVAYAQSVGIDVIITDHHQVPPKDDIPPAYAIIHPMVFADRYPFKGLCGAGVAFKLVQGMLKSKFFRDRLESRGFSSEGFEKWLLDLVCVATIADCMPITDENRTLVHFGLIVLKKTRRPGLRALFHEARIDSAKISPYTIGFQIAPRLNAASRMEHGELAFELLTTGDAGRAQELAKILDATNLRRRKLTDEIFKKAQGVLANQFEDGKKILVGIGSDWSAGVLGLVASKLMNEYNRSVVLITQSPAGRIGAARSVESIHITNIFRKIEHLFTRFGGHAAAGGFAVKETFDESAIVQHFHQAAENESLPQEGIKPEVIDAEIMLSDVTLEVIERLKKLEPFGIGNEKPKFLIRTAIVQDIAYVGSNRKHVRFLFQQGSARRRGIGFSLAPNARELSVGDHVDILTELDVNEWQGNCEPQLSLIDFHKP